MLEAKSLRKATIPSTILPYPSPASIQPTRLAIHVNHEDDIDFTSCSAYFASGRHMYRLEIPVGDSLLNQGKEGLLIPDIVEVVGSSMIDQCRHQYEIQSVALAKTGSAETCILGSVDSHGHLIVSLVNTDAKDTQKPTYVASPQDRGVGEGSWAGLSFSPTQCSTVAVARSFPKCIDLYDQENHIRNLRTLWYPSSLTFVQSPFYQTESSVLAVTEGCQLTLWDLRMKENGGCIHRICGSPGDILYDSSTSTTGNIAVAGADRTVTIFDPRRSQVWRSQHLTLITSMSKEWTMRSFVEIGAKVQRSFHLEGTQAGLDLISVPREMWWGDGVIQEASLWLILMLREILKTLSRLYPMGMRK